MNFTPLAQPLPWRIALVTFITITGSCLLTLSTTNAKTLELTKIRDINPPPLGGLFVQRGINPHPTNLAINYQLSTINSLTKPTPIIAVLADDGDMTPVQKNGRWGYVDKSNGRMTKFIYDEADYFSQGLGKVKSGSKYGFINRAGKVIIPIQYDEAETFYGADNGLSLVKRQGKYGYIDLTGKEVIPLKFSSASGFYDGDVTWVSIDNKYGYIDRTGKQVIDMQFDEAQSFFEGLARVKISDKWGYIDKSGKQVIKPQFEEVEDFRSGLAIVKLNGKTVYIDKTAKVIWNGEAPVK